MAKEPTIYDLMLLLSTSAEDERRAQILADVEAAIPNGGGRIERNDDWGSRPLPYRIRHQREAEYHLLQFTRPDVAAGVALAQPADRRRRTALPDHQGAPRARPPPPESAPPVVAQAVPRRRGRVGPGQSTR